MAKKVDSYSLRSMQNTVRQLGMKYIEKLKYVYDAQKQRVREKPAIRKGCEEKEAMVSWTRVECILCSMARTRVLLMMLEDIIELYLMYRTNAQQTDREQVRI
jgi:hypothetical protein